MQNSSRIQDSSRRSTSRDFTPSTPQRKHSDSEKLTRCVTGSTEEDSQATWTLPNIVLVQDQFQHDSHHMARRPSGMFVVTHVSTPEATCTNKRPRQKTDLLSGQPPSLSRRNSARSTASSHRSGPDDEDYNLEGDDAQASTRALLSLSRRESGSVLMGASSHHHHMMNASSHHSQRIRRPPTRSSSRKSLTRRMSGCTTQDAELALEDISFHNGSSHHPQHQHVRRTPSRTSSRKSLTRRMSGRTGSEDAELALEDISYHTSSNSRRPALSRTNSRKSLTRRMSGRSSAEDAELALQDISVHNSHSQTFRPTLSRTSSRQSTCSTTRDTAEMNLRDMLMHSQHSSSPPLGRQRSVSRSDSRHQSYLVKKLSEHSQDRSQLRMSDHRTAADLLQSAVEAVQSVSSH
mgnify:CR=1 FL=1